MAKEWVAPANPTEIDWAKFAAYIDGEGSIGIRLRKRANGRKACHVVTIVMSNTDPRLIRWCKETFKCGSISARKVWRMNSLYGIKSHKVSWIWEIQAKCAEWALFRCLPYFTIKREQAELCLELRRTMGTGFGRSTENKPVSSEKLAYRQDLKERLTLLKKAVGEQCVKK